MALVLEKQCTRNVVLPCKRTSFFDIEMYSQDSGLFILNAVVIVIHLDIEEVVSIVAMFSL